jgi:NAD(P)H-flavin reductase
MPEPAASFATQAQRTPAMLPERYRVTRAIAENTDVVTLEIAPVDGGEVATFEPGQFNMLYAFGVGEIPISMSGDPADRGGYVHSIRRVGTVSGALSRLQAGDMLGVRGPFGSAWPVTAARGGDVLIVAGGIGLLPLRPLLCRLAAERERYGRVMLIYGGRRPSELVFTQALDRWRRESGIEVLVTVDFADEHWHGAVGTVLPLLSRLRLHPDRLTAFVCGPEIMMTRTIVELGNRGLAPERMYLSLERNMKCAIGLCGHCQLGSHFVCREGAVFDYARAEALLRVPEL